MRTVRRSALVPYSASQMFALVDDIEAYPDFLPWCSRAEVHHRDAGQAEASLELSRGGIRKSFRTRNSLRPPTAIDLELIDGPFRQLAGSWTFRDIGNDGCKVNLDLDFEFDNRVTDMVFGPFFEEIGNRLVDAFTRRAAAVYG